MLRLSSADVFAVVWSEPRVCPPPASFRCRAHPLPPPSSSAAEISASARTHLQSCLHPAVVAPAALTSFLAEGRCVPLDEAPRLAVKKADAEPAAAEAVPPVRILDLSTAPPTEVCFLSAFGMQWAPIVAQPQAANHQPASEPKQALVTFYSVPSALFQRPSSALLTYEQRLKQLPSALASNAAAMKQAEESGEISDVGVLYLESKKLHSELSKLQSESPPANDLVEVRESMQLPLGFVPLDGKLVRQPRSSDRQSSRRCIRSECCNSLCSQRCE